MDRIYARGENDVLFNQENIAAYTQSTRKTFERVLDKVIKAFKYLYAQPNGLRVIHNDLWHGNINVYRSRLHPLDFEDTIWGHPVQDIAMALQDLMTDVRPMDYDPLMGAFRDGYESIAPWPERYEGEIDTFRAGRMIWVANYVARYENTYLRKHLDAGAILFEGFLNTGKLRKLKIS